MPYTYAEMLFLKYNVLLLLVIFLTTNAERKQRKLTNGNKALSESRYMIHLTKAPMSPQPYDYWICGGAIVSPSFIVTSAACVEDVEFMYAISGTKKYLNKVLLEKNECIMSTRKKIIMTCVPKAYELKYDQVEKWAGLDIAVAQVETPFDFNAKSPTNGCDFVPDKIMVNYELKAQRPDTDTFTLGWGHKEKWREANDTRDYNSDDLEYAPMRIVPHEECKQAYRQQKGLVALIDKYMICAMSGGSRDDNGYLVEKPVLVSGSTPKGSVLRAGTVYCSEDVLRQAPAINRQGGLCQNDHGGPLIGWMGSNSVLLGVSSVFLLTQDLKCIGPYLFTSTHCNGGFLSCLIVPDLTRRSGYTSSAIEGELLKTCKLPPKERGFVEVKRRISWKHHPDGPAQNELQLDEDLIDRPQIPMSFFGH